MSSGVRAGDGQAETAEAAGVRPEDLEEFFQFLRFASISAQPEYRADVEACAEWLRGVLGQWGLAAELLEPAPDAPPVVVARSVAEAGRPTVLVYGHYDVQPVEPLELWESAPFEPRVKDGMVVARGATDNKGQSFSLLLAVKHLLASPRGAPANVIVVMEGEEEVGSPHFGDFLKEHGARLACDAAVIADTSMIAPGQPALTLGLRGILCVEVTATGPARDLHSGMFGGPAPNPAMALCRVLGRLHDAEGQIAIPGFYEDVLSVAPAELDSWAQLPWNEEWFEKATGIRPVAGEKNRTLLEKLWARPTAEINGLTSGHQGAGSKTIIPSKASAKLSFRLAPRQSSEAVAGLVKEWFESELADEGVRGEVWIDHGAEPFYLSPDEPVIRLAAEALEAVFGKPPALTREGLSIPAARMVREHLKVPVVLAGLGLPDCRAHAPNETFPLAHLSLGARFFEDFLARL